ALARRRPPRGLLHHSDRGSQYASGDYQRMLAQHGIVCSMSRRGDCWDNAVAESFFATLKVDAAWTTRAAARRELFDYLEPFYNGRRRHRRWAISVPERSSSSGNTQHWPSIPGVYEIGACTNRRHQVKDTQA